MQIAGSLTFALVIGFAMGRTSTKAPEHHSSDRRERIAAPETPASVRDPYRTSADDVELSDRPKVERDLARLHTELAPNWIRRRIAASDLDRLLSRLGKHHTRSQGVETEFEPESEVVTEADVEAMAAKLVIAFDERLREAEGEPPEHDDLDTHE